MEKGPEHEDTRAESATEASMLEAYSQAVDLSNCDVEPLHRILVVQDYACVLGVDPTSFSITHASDNARKFVGVEATDLLGATLDELLSATDLAALRRGLQGGAVELLNPYSVTFGVDGAQREMHLVANLASPSQLILEIEPSHQSERQSVLLNRFGRAIQRIQSITDYELLFAETAKVLRESTGYDRVLIYRFDGNRNGEVVAEALTEGLTPFQGLRFPASDIPQQARDLYLRNQVRILANVRERPAKLLQDPAVGDDSDLDLSLVSARGLSPIHREYLINMGVAATMSVAIVLDGRLWGLFAMHHHSPRWLNYHARSHLRFLGHVFSGQLSAQAARRLRDRTLEMSRLQTQLSLEIESANSLVEGLAAAEVNVLDTIRGTTGAAVSFGGEIRLVGDTPSRDEVIELTEWVTERSGGSTTYRVDSLAAQYPGGGALLPSVAGLLLVWIDRAQADYIVWFRPEIVRTVTWGGNPTKVLVATQSGTRRFSPRKSFSSYIEQIAKHCEAWTPEDEDAALTLRAHLKDVVVRRFQEIQTLNGELAAAYDSMEAFTFTVSHDLGAPVRVVKGFSQILREDYAEQLDGNALELIATIEKSAERMEKFMTELLELSRLGRSSLNVQDVDVAGLVHASIEELEQLMLAQQEVQKRNVQFEVQENLPTAFGDPQLLTVVFANLLGNAIKYSLDRQNTLIKVGTVAHEDSAGGVAYFVRDNGMGLDPKHAEQIFDLFTRMNDDPRIQGSGIGLALVSNVIRKHNGKLWVDSELGRGATFFFTLGLTREDTESPPRGSDAG